MSRRLVTDPIGSDAYLVFERDMADLKEMEIKNGTNKSKDFTGFFTFPAFREMCRVSPDDLGLPNARDAMKEACCSQDWDNHDWSHPAVLLAAREVGSYDMRNMTERELFPIFSHAYDQLVRRVVAGETLEAPIRKALPAKSVVPLTEEQEQERLEKNRAAMARMKALFN